MAEYIEREAMVKASCERCNGEYVPCDKEHCLLMEVIHSIPAADVREVVYCKDCRHRDPEDHKCDCGGMERQGCPFKVDDDYFCAYGERLTNGADMRGAE